MVFITYTDQAIYRKYFTQQKFINIYRILLTYRSSYVKLLKSSSDNNVVYLSNVEERCLTSQLFFNHALFWSLYFVQYVVIRNDHRIYIPYHWPWDQAAFLEITSQTVCKLREYFSSTNGLRYATWQWHLCNKESVSHKRRVIASSIWCSRVILFDLTLHFRRGTFVSFVYCASCSVAIDVSLYFFYDFPTDSYFDIILSASFVRSIRSLNFLARTISYPMISRFVFLEELK